jgi:hypothetical protein
MEDLETRLSEAETEGRRWRRLTCALTIAVAAVLLVAAKKQQSIVPELIIARRLVAVNERGELVALMGHVKNVGIMGIATADGTMMFAATSADGRGVASTYNHLGRELVTTGSDRSGQGTIFLSSQQRGMRVAKESPVSAGSQPGG